ncbi:MAG: VENN motif pre-toxin domain-containing protein [Acidovorax sp.]|uniref:DUF6862 domain-containing protein n=1 Tax=Acidovorax sp. TaxID=1872122 RepID=UPI0025BAD1A4|nr:VENN motif pre-toxin domain-containing protein [Acidovorax sp.]MCE1190631.1 VENN motif pre-toxin domain-containing protein [Acidovorax sp.]
MTTPHPLWKRVVVWLVLVSFTQASVAQAAIGDTFKNSEAPVQNLLAHAVLGCATGVVKSRGEGQGCAAGAAGAVAGDVAGQRAHEAGMGDGDATLVASVTGGVAAALVGDRDKVSESYGLGASAGENAFTNNYLKHTEINDRIAAKKACDAKDEAACTKYEELNRLDAKRQEELGDCVGIATVACDAVRAEAKTTAQGLDLYTRALVDKVDKGEMTYAQAKPYMDQTQREKRDITSPLAADAYVRSGGVADPGNPAWVEYKALTATEGNDAAMALGMGSAGGRYEGQRGGKAPAGVRPAEGEGAGSPSAGANGGVVTTVIEPKNRPTNGQSGMDC